MTGEERAPAEPRVRRMPGVRPVVIAVAAVLVAAAGGCSSSPAIDTRQTPTVSTGQSGGAQPATPRQRPASAPRMQTNDRHESFTVSARLEKWRLPRPVGREVVVQYRGGALVAGGLVSGDRSTADVYEIDLRTGETTGLAPLKVAVHDAAGGLLGNRPVVVGGGNATEQRIVQRLGTGGWRVVGQLSSSRSDLAVVTTRHRLVVVGGYDGTTSAAMVLTSSDGHHFTAVGRLPVPVRYPAVVADRGAVWVFGGETNGHLVDAVQRVDISSGRARRVGRLPRPLGHAAAAVVDGVVIVAGGRTAADSVTAQMWSFNPSTRTFERAGQLPHPLADAGVVTTSTGTFLIGGETPDLSDRIVRLLVSFGQSVR